MGKNILSADIGGTNSRFAHFVVAENGGLRFRKSSWLRTGEAGSFSDLLETLSGTDFSLKPSDSDIAVIAVAGPVEHGVYSAPPFITWEIDVSHAEADYGISRCMLINDFVAQAYACRSLLGEKALTILEGEVSYEAAAAVIGAGTGLGMAALVPDKRGGYIAVPSEGGHANFPFVSHEENAYQEFLMKNINEEYVTGNTVVSGKGLSFLHHFLAGEKLEPKEVADRLSTEPETLRWAARFYGRVCRNFALETLSFGGLYIAGGVAAKTPELVRHAAFEKEFRSSSTMSHILGNIPVFLITDQESGLWGAAFLGQQLLKEYNDRGNHAA